MVPPDRIKPFLLHEDKYVRAASMDYFAESWSRDPEVLPLVLDARERFGDGADVRWWIACDQLPLTGPTFDRLLRHLAGTDDEDTKDRLNRVIGHAPGDLLVAKQAEILGHPGLSPKTASQIKLRCDLAGWSGERLWDELQDYARRSADKFDTSGIDHDYVDALVDALSRHDVPDADTVSQLLRTLEPDKGWLEIFLVDLAGARRIPEAIPALVEKFRIDTDYLLERSKEALVRIGDPEAVRLIRAAYPTAPEQFKHYTSEIFGLIKHEESEEAILELLGGETDPDFRTLLCLGLCDLFSERGIEVVKRVIAAGYDTWIASLEEHLLPVAEVLNVELPEAAEWKQRRAREEARLAARLAEMAEAERRYRDRKTQAVDPYASLLASEPYPAAPAPIQRAGPRVGRNAPCPCGSGKKFKKCCGQNP